MLIVEMRMVPPGTSCEAVSRAKVQIAVNGASTALRLGERSWGGLMVDLVSASLSRPRRTSRKIVSLPFEHPFDAGSGDSHGSPRNKLRGRKQPGVDVAVDCSGTDLQVRSGLRHSEVIAV